MTDIGKETLRCAGGPFDGQDATTDRFCMTMVRHSMADPAVAYDGEDPYIFGKTGPSKTVVAIRSFYTYRKMSDGTAYWQFERSEPLYLVSA